jgi:hypothetical protein
VASAAQLLGVPIESMLSIDEAAAVAGRGDPQILRRERVRP